MGKRVVDRAIGLIGRVDKQRYRRLHRFLLQQRQDAVSIWRAFNQHYIRLQLLQRSLQCPGAARTMVPDSKDMH
jgi:hypothetical protein